MELGHVSNGAQKLKKIGSRVLSRATDKAGIAIDCITDFKKSVYRVGKEGCYQIERRTKKEPFAALIVATSAGFLAGWLIGRNRE